MFFFAGGRIRAEKRVIIDTVYIRYAKLCMYLCMERSEMRKRLFEIIETAKEDDRLSNVYDVFMMVVIIASMVPLAFKSENTVFFWIDKTAAVIFVLDYLLRLSTADMKLGKKTLSFFLYPFTPMAIIDLLCILPSLHVIQSGFRILKVFRLFRALRVFRIFKAVRYSRSIQLIKNVFITQKKSFLTVGLLAFAYILICALVVFNVEPDSFENFFDAIYWAMVSLTTMGYGDIYPVTTVGRLVTMASSVFGIAIIALPSGIITAGFLEGLNKERYRNEEKDRKEEKDKTE